MSACVIIYSATGAAGASILGSYDTYAQLIEEHPTGTQGDAYLVDGVLYVWEDSSAGWQSMGSLVGPPGATGEPGLRGLDGENGADGIIGQIDGTVQSTGDLPDDGIEQGTIYYVEEDEALYVWDAATQGWIRLGVAQGPRGVTGPTATTVYAQLYRENKWGTHAV